KLDVQATQPLLSRAAILGLPLLVALDRCDTLGLVASGDPRPQVATRLTTRRRVTPGLPKNAAPADDTAATLHPLTRTLLLDVGDATLDLRQEGLLVRKLVGKSERELELLGHRALLTEEVTWSLRLQRTSRKQCLDESGAGPVVHLLDQTVFDRIGRDV